MQLLFFVAVCVTGRCSLRFAACAGIVIKRSGQPAEVLALQIRKIALAVATSVTDLAGRASKVAPDAKTAGL